MRQVMIQTGIRTKAQVVVELFSQKQLACQHNGEFQAKYIEANNIM